MNGNSEEKVITNWLGKLAWAAISVCVLGTGTNTVYTIYNPSQEAQRLKVDTTTTLVATLSSEVRALKDNEVLGLSDRLSKIEGEQNERAALFKTMGEMTAAVKYQGEMIIELKEAVKELGREIKAKQ